MRTRNFSNVPARLIRHAGRHAYIASSNYGEHVTLDGDDVTREHCVIESITMSGDTWIHSQPKGIQP